MARFNPLEIAFDVAAFIPKAIISISGKMADHIEELKRRRKLEEQRRSTSPSYGDGVAEKEFEQIVLKAKKDIPRIKSVFIKGLVVDIEVRSQSGISIWQATVDFNDFGHLTDWYRIWSENDDSNIPEAFAGDVIEGIRLCREANGFPRTMEKVCNNAKL